MTTQALTIQDLMSKMTAIQLAYNNLQASNTFSGNLVTPATITAIQTAITTAQNAVNALAPVFMGNN